MQLQAILNRVQKFKSFVYGKARWVTEGERLALEVEVHARKNGRPVCSGCQQRGPCYDRLRPRRFEFVPLWGIVVFLLYAMRRVDCPGCGVKVEQVPWAEGKSHQTTTYQWFLAQWGKRLSWQQVATVFGTSWDTVYRAVLMAVAWGIRHRNLAGIEAIGVDEIQWQWGQQYLTVVYQVGPGVKRLLYVGKDRTEQSLRSFFEMLGRKRAAAIRYVCSDMWQPYLTVIAQMAHRAIHVLDRFHIVKLMNEALDQVRRQEARQMKVEGSEPLLKHARWCLLKRPKNLTDVQATKLADLVRYNLRSVRAYLLKEEFQRFWDYQIPGFAARFLDTWCTRVMRSRLDPMKKVVATLRSHKSLLLNWFRARGAICVGAVEGMNNHAKVIMRKAYGFRNFLIYQVALYHGLGDLPEPNFTHRFC
jgi:transposase